MVKVSAEIVAFLRNMESEIKLQQTPVIAYRSAVEKTGTLQTYLEPSVEQMESGVPFLEALRTTLDKLPLRSWSIFVRQMELHERAGGSLADAIASTARHLNMTLRLQGDARTQYAS